MDARAMSAAEIRVTVEVEDDTSRVEIILPMSVAEAVGDGAREGDSEHRTVLAVPRLREEDRDALGYLVSEASAGARDALQSTTDSAPAFWSETGVGPSLMRMALRQGQHTKAIDDLAARITALEEQRQVPVKTEPATSAQEALAGIVETLRNLGGRGGLPDG